MSSLLYRLGRFSFRRHWTVVGIWLLGILILGGVTLVGGGASYVDNPTIPGTESQRGLTLLSERFPQLAGTSAQVVYQNDDGDLSSPRDRRVVDAALKRLQKVDHVELVAPIYGETASNTISSNGHIAQTQVQLNVNSNNRKEVLRQVEEAAKVPADSGIRTEVGGAAFQDVGFALGATEIIGVGFAFLVMAIAFSSLISAILPLVTAIVAIIAAIAGIAAASTGTDVSSIAQTLSLMVGLALGIDYSLFVGNRYRHELAVGTPAEQAAGVAVATSGAAVVFAGTTVFIALCALSVVGIPMLSVIGISAGCTVLVTVLVALTVLPAAFGILGPRLVPKPRSKAAKRELADPHAAHTMGARWIRLITRRSAIVAGVIALAGLAAVIPARQLTLALPDAGSAPTDSPQRITYDLLSEGFGPGFNAPLIVTADISTNNDVLGVVKGLKEDVETLGGVKAVTLATPNQSLDLALLQVIPKGDQTSQATKDLVQSIRDRAPELEKKHSVHDLWVTGQTAAIIDVSDMISRALLPFGLIVVGLSLVLLTVVFRSLVVPLTAAAGYVLSLFVAFGATVAVFQWGWAADLLNVAKVGPVVSFLPIIVMGILFGLAMDYQVFLVSRMREEYVKGDTAHNAVKVGYVRSIRVVAAAAIIMTSVFLGFIPHGDSYIQPIAFALAVGILFDAFIVRMTLVPAVMYLLGEKAWWLPGWLERHLPQLDVEGAVIEQRLGQAEWEAQNGVAAVRAVEVRLGDHTWDTVIRPGEMVRFEPGADGIALVRAIAGRGEIDDGHLTVMGRVAGSEDGALRTEIGFVGEPVEATGSVSEYLASDARLHHFRRAAQKHWRDAAARWASTLVAMPQQDVPLATLSISQRQALDAGRALASGVSMLCVLDPGPEFERGLYTLAAHQITVAVATSKNLVTATTPVQAAGRSEGAEQ